MSEPGERSTIVKYAVGALAVAALGVFLLDLLEGPFYSFSTKTWPPERRGDKMVGRIQGPLKVADPQTNTVSISSGFLGLASLPVVVTPQTKISVNGKLGGFADLDRGQLVRVAYEVSPDRRVASLVEVLDRWSDSPDGSMPPLDPDAPAVERASASDTTPQTAPARAAEPGSRAQAPPAAPATPGAPAPPARPTEPAKAKAPPVAPWTAVSPPAPASPPPAPSPPSARSNAVNPAPAAKRPVGGPSSSPRTSQETPRRAPPASPPPAQRAVTPGSPPAGDGGAVLDWLRKESRP